MDLLSKAAWGAEGALVCSVVDELEECAFSAAS